MSLCYRIVLLIPLLIVSCKDKSEYTYYENGKVESKMSPLDDSTKIFLGYYKNGTLRDSMIIVNGYLKGRARNYFQNGRIAKDCYWENGLPNGPCTSYYESGNLKSIVNFEDSVKIGNAYEYYDLPGRKLRFAGNYTKVNGKKWVNSTTSYDSLGNIEKASVQIREIKGQKQISIKDSLKLTFNLDHLELPFIRVFIGDYDRNYNLPEYAKEKVYDGKGKTIVAYIFPKTIGKNTARGYVQNYKVVEKFKDGTYKTYGKDIYWSYDYDVVQ